MADPRSPLSGMIQALRKAADPWERLKIVTRGARSLSRLPPEKRRDLLRRLGLSGAEDLLTHLADDAGPDTVAAIQHAFDRLERDPETASRLIGDLVNPETRDATLGGLIAHLEEVAVNVPEPDASGKEAADAHGDRPTAVIAPPLARSRAHDDERDRRPPAAAGTEVASPSAGQAGSSAEERAAIPGRSDADPSSLPLATGNRELLPELEVDFEALRVSPPTPKPLGDPEPTDEAEEERIEDRLSRLPSGWARRRVLERVLRGEAGEDLDRALELVERFAEPAERLWCLTALAARHPRSREEWNRLIAAADTAATRRRLEMRRRRAGVGG